MWREIVRALGAALFITIGLPLLFVAILGFLGVLSDTSPAENRRHGMIFGALSLVTLLPWVLSFFPRRNR